MKPNSLSATALLVADACLARYHAENILRTPAPQHASAGLGTALHAALEWYVRAVYIEKSEPDSLPRLLGLFRMHYCSELGTFEPEADEGYREGREMLERWHARTSFDNVEVLSVEEKLSFPVPTSVGDIPFNYIFDRFDRLTDEPDTYRVVDYKSVRLAISPKELHAKVQARAYGLAAQIQIPSAKKIWVCFDLLRHDQVATTFTRAENIATWKWIRAMAEKILAADPEGGLPETLNPECKFCVRKTSCDMLGRNIIGAGLFSNAETDYLVDLRTMLDYQNKGIKAALIEIDDLLLTTAAETEQLEFETANSKLVVAQSMRQAVDPTRALLIAGPDLMAKYDGAATLSDFKKMIKDPSVNPSQRMALEDLIYKKPGEPYLKTVLKNPID